MCLFFHICSQIWRSDIRCLFFLCIQSPVWGYLMHICVLCFSFPLLSGFFKKVIFTSWYISPLFLISSFSTSVWVLPCFLFILHTAFSKKKKNPGERRDRAIYWLTWLGCSGLPPWVHTWWRWAERGHLLSLTSITSLGILLFTLACFFFFIIKPRGLLPSPQGRGFPRCGSCSPAASQLISRSFPCFSVVLFLLFFM